MNKSIKYLLTCFTAMATILWSLSPLIAVLPVGVQKTQAASTTVSLHGCGANMDEPCYYIEPQGDVAQASSGALPLFSFNLEKSSGSSTLNTVTINLVDPQGTPTTEAADIASLAVYKRTDWSGWGEYAFPAGDKIGEQTTINAFSSGTSADNIIDIDPDDAVGTDRWAATYYVTMSTASTWGASAATDQITYTLPADWIGLSGSETLGSACAGNPTYCQPDGDYYYATAPDGWVGESFAVEDVDYMSTDDSGDYEVEVRFSDDVTETGASGVETLTNFNIGGTNPTAAMLIAPQVVRLTFASSVTITVNETALVIDKDITSIGGTVLSTTADPNMTIMGSGGGGGGGGSVAISEAMIGTASSGLEEFIELYNQDSTNAFDLSTTNMHIWIATGTAGNVTHTKIADLASGSIAANGYYLIASDEYTGISPSADATYDASAVAGGTTEGALRANSGVYISTSTTQNIAINDKLGWGTATGDMSYGMPKCSSSDPDSCTVANDGTSLERKANYASTATTMSSGGADETNGNFYMSHDNQYDFVQIPAVSVAPQSTASTAETPGGSGYGANNNYPYINHEPIMSVPATQDLVVMAEITDDSGQIAGSNTKLYYRTNNPAGSWSSTSGSQTMTGSSTYRFTVPSSALNASQDLDYYLRAYDNTNYTCLPPGTDGTSSSCGANDLIASGSTPWTIDVTASGGSGVISGTVQNASGSSIPGVMIYTQGMPYTATTDSSGSFSMRNLPDGVYDIIAQGGTYTVGNSTANYLEGGTYGLYLTSVNQTSTGNTITLIQGVVENRGGTSADAEAPWIVWSAPNDMMMGFPMGDSLIVVFDKTMQASTITGGTAITDNIYLSDSSGTAVAGTVTYCTGSDITDTCYQDGSEVAGNRMTYATNAPPASDDANILIYNPTADLTPGSGYMLVIADTVLGQNGQRLMGNRSSGFGQNIGFTVAMDYGSMAAGSTGTGTNAGDYSFGSGASYPPYVVGTTPGSGAYDTALNAKININFNEAMSASSINTTNIKLYTVANIHTASETETLISGYTVTQNTAGDMAIITPSSNLTANTQYRVKVLSNCTSADGTPMSTANNAEQFRIDFGTSATIDSSAPTVAGTYPSNSETGVPSNLPSASIGFSESMDSSTITASNIKLKRGTTIVSSTIEYNVGDRTAYLMPNNSLRPGAEYTIQIGTGVTDIVGNALAAVSETTFTTDSTIDITAPYIEFARCDDYVCSITYSEPMNNARVGETDFTNNASALKPGNYSVACATCSVTPSVSSARVEYDQMNNTVSLEGVSGLQSNNSFTITVSNAQDKAGNTIGSPSSFTGTVESNMGTGGMMGPGGPGPMMGPATMMDAGGDSYGGAGFSAGEGTMTAGMGGGMGFDFGGMWMEPVNAMPMNMMAGATTQYMVEFKADAAIPAGGTIKLTFPTGTVVTNAEPVATTQSMANKDLNGEMASGTVTIAGTDTTGAANNDGVAANNTARTVTVTINASGDGIATNDRVMFDLKGIKNPSVPKGFDTNGYTVDIKTFNASNALLQSETSMPYFINEAGAYTLSGTVTATDATDGNLEVYVDSWQTGPLSTEIDFGTNADGTADYSFTGLSEGNYHIHTEPSVSLTGGTFIGYNTPEGIWVSSSNTTAGECNSTTTCDKDITLQKEDSSTAHELTVQIVGDFSSMSGSDLDLDIWAGGPNGHTVKAVTVLAQDYTAGSPYSANLYLPSAGEYWVRVGPQMPKGMMMMGPPPMPSWMPPGDIRVTVSGSYGSETWDEQSVTANDGTIRFSITSASNQIIGYVVDSSGTAIANVDVDAHRTQGGFGMPSHAQTDSNGKFTLKVSTGIYEVNAWQPGMPWSPGRVVDVRDDTSNSATDGNSTADVYKDNGTTLVLDATSGYDASTPEEELLIKLNKSSTTISGNLLDNNGDPVAYAPVWAYSSTTGEHRPSGTDSSGAYTIYVPDGTWYIEAHIPGLGDVSYSNNPVTVSGSSISDVDIRPSTNTTFYIISGTITISGSTVSNASVWVDRSTYHNHTNTNSSGEYRLSVPANSGYSLKAWTPDYGELDPVTIDASSGNVTQNFTVDAGSMHALTINFTNQGNLESGTSAFIDIFDPSARKGNHKYIDDITNASSTTMSVKDGDNYEVHMNIPGLGGVEATCAGNAACAANASGPDTWTFSDDTTLAFSLPDTSSLYTFTITVEDSSSTALDTAFAWIGGSSFHSGEPTNSSGVATLRVPAGSYEVGGDKPGYTLSSITAVTPGTLTGDGALASVCSNSDPETNMACSITVTLASNPYNLTGTITDASGNAVSGAWVWADKVNSATDLSFAGGWTGSETDPDGTYELSISDGYWIIRAVSDSSAETSYNSGTPLQVNAASQTGINIQMTARSGYTATVPKSSPVTPANGGTIDDISGTGVKLVIPPSALGTDTSASTINITDTYSVPRTTAMSPVGGKGKSINATNSSGQAVTDLSGAVSLTIAYDEDDLASTFDEANLVCGYYDNSSNQWVEVPATVDATNNEVTCSTTHFSDFALLVATSSVATPTGLSATAVSSSQIDLSWTQVTGATSYDVYRSATSGGTYSRLGSEPTVSSGSTTTYSDTGLSQGTIYYYKVSALDDDGESASSSAVNATTDSVGGPPLPPQTNNDNNNDDEDNDTDSDTDDIDDENIIQAISSKPDGTLIKADDSDKIYVVRDGKKLWIPNANVFEKAGYKWSDIQTVEASEISETSTADLIKAPDSDKVYIIKQGTRIHVANPAVFEAAGYKWGDIATATSGDVSAFVDTNLVKAENSDSIYTLVNGMKRHIRTAKAFDSYSHDWGKIATMSATEVNAYPDNNLIKDPDSDKVYLLEEQTRRWIYDGTVFDREGYNWDNIVEVSSEDLADYTDGVTIE